MAIQKRKRNGKVWLDKDGNPRWDIVVYMGTDPITGERRKPYRESFEDYEEAKRVEAEVKAQKHDSRPMASDQTVGEYMRWWLDDHVSTQVRDGTLAGYRWRMERYILDPPKGCPVLAGLKLRDLTVQHLNSLYAFMYRTGASGRGMKSRSVRNAHAVYHNALEDARRMGKIRYNPASDVTIPKDEAKATKGDQHEKRVRTMDWDQAMRFEAAARAERTEDNELVTFGARYSALFHVLLWGGLRPTEAFALEWTDVDMADGTIYVQGSLNRKGLDPDEHPDGWQLTPPKTEAGTRLIHPPEAVFDELAEWRQQQVWQRARAGDEWDEFGFVFTASTGQPLRHRSVRRHAFNRVMRRAELGTFEGPEPEKPATGPTPLRPFSPAFTVYELRHTCVSLLIDLGLPLKYISEYIGHKSISITADVYGHLFEAAKRERRDEMNAALRARREQHRIA